MKKPDDKGFTLIELLVVISIIGMLSSVILAGLQSAREKGKIGAAQKFDTYTYHAFGTDAVAIWNFDEGSGNIAYDSSGNNNNLILNNISSGVDWSDSSDSVHGDGALNFTSAGQTYASGGDAAIANFKGFSRQNGSISFWIKPKTNSNSPAYIQTVLSMPSNNFYIWAYGSGAGVPQPAIAVWTYFGTISSQTSSPLVISSLIGKWTHVLISWNKPTNGYGTMKWYINGQLVREVNDYNPPSVNCNSSCYIHIGNQATFRFLDAYLDEMYIYRQSFQTAQVERLYVQGAARHGIAINQ